MKPHDTRTGTLSAYTADLCRAMEGVPAEGFNKLRDHVLGLRDSSGTLFLAGNGGSAATANHFAADLMKRSGFRLRCRSLSDSGALITAISNDIAYDAVFTLPYELLAGDGDLLIVVSASGKSPNIVAVAQAARQKGRTVAALTAFDGGSLVDIAQPCIVVPTDDAGIAEDARAAILHAIARSLEAVET